MDYLYLGVMFIPGLLLALILIFFGLENQKEAEIFKGVVSRTVYFLQFIASMMYLFYHQGISEVNFTFVHLTNYHYNLMFSIERFQIGFAVIFSLLFISIEKMSFNYLHAEEEHAKFYGLKAILNVAIMFFVFSSNIDFLFFSWELVGLSSALLISYFYRRNQAVENSMFAFSVYRICDAAFLITGMMLYYFHHTENINTISTGLSATILGILLFFTIMGKSGVYPLSAWLPLALEGPTPSSNLYYMAVSTHLGALLLIKTHTLWENSVVAKGLMLVFLIVSIVLHSLSARVQPTIKAAIAYSTLAHVSVILVEIVFGFYTFALVHIGLHVFYRFTQMTTSTSIIDQHNQLEKVSGLNEHYTSNVSLYFKALNGFGSELFILKIYKFLLWPFFLLDNLENIIFKNEVVRNKLVNFSMYNFRSFKK